VSCIHQAERVGADVRLPDIVTEDDEDVQASAAGRRLLCLCLLHRPGKPDSAQYRQGSAPQQKLPPI
jgi:hypothetical protein